MTVGLRKANRRRSITRSEESGGGAGRDGQRRGAGAAEPAAGAGACDSARANARVTASIGSRPGAELSLYPDLRRSRPWGFSARGDRAGDGVPPEEGDDEQQDPGDDRERGEGREAQVVRVAPPTDGEGADPGARQVASGDEGRRPLEPEAAPPQLSSTRIGSTIAWTPSNCSRRWIASAVSLWRSRWYHFSFPKISLPVKKIARGNSSAISRAELLEVVDGLRADRHPVVGAQPCCAAQATYFFRLARCSPRGARSLRRP